jgi:hypothetical protein
MSINERILNAYNLSKLNIDIVEILENIARDWSDTNDLTLESFDLYDMLRYKYDENYTYVINTLFTNLNLFVKNHN